MNLGKANLKSKRIFIICRRIERLSERYFKTVHHKYKININIISERVKIILIIRYKNMQDRLIQYIPNLEISTKRKFTDQHTEYM